MDDFCRVFIRRKNRIENLCNVASFDDERQPFDQSHAVEFKRREPQSLGEHEICVAQNLKRQPKPLYELLLIGRCLRAETEYFRAQRTELRVMVAE